MQVRSLVCASPQASKPLVTESGLQTSSPAAPHADLHFLTVRIMIKAHSGHTEMRGKRLVKAARPGRSRRRHGGLAYAPAAAPATARPIRRSGWREEEQSRRRTPRQVRRGRGRFDKGPSRRLHRAERGQARSQPDRGRAYEPPPLVKSATPFAPRLTLPAV